MYQSLHLLDGVDHARNYGIHPIPLHIYNEKRAVLPRLLCLCCAQHFWFAELFWGLLWYSTLLCMHKFVRGKYKPKNTELDSSLQAVRSTRSCSGRGAALALATGAPSRRNWHGTPPGMSRSCKHVAQRFMFKALPYLQLESLVCRISSAFNLETTLMPKWNQLNLLKTVVQAKKSWSHIWTEVHSIQKLTIQKLNHTHTAVASMFACSGQSRGSIPAGSSPASCRPKVQGRARKGKEEGIIWGV